MKKTTIEQSNQAVSESLSQSAMHNKAPAFAKGQHVKVGSGSIYGVVVEVKKESAIVRVPEITDPGNDRIDVPLRMLSISWPFEIKWIESLLAAQKRYYKPGSIEAAIAAN